MAERKDQFANVATILVTESAANTLTFKKLETGISLNEKVAWIISRIEYNLAGAIWSYMNAALDAFYFGISVSNTAASMSSLAAFTDSSLIDWNGFTRQDIGAAATGLFQDNIFLKDFSSLPMGGLIVPPQPLYAYAQGSGLTNVGNMVAKIFYTTLSLSVDQYWELVEARRVLSS